MPERDKYETAILQDLIELYQFIDILKAEDVRSYLEIGSKFGGSLWLVANALPKGSRIVSVDLPHGDGSFKETQPPLERCAGRLSDSGYNVTLLLADSTHKRTIETVTKLAPFDCIFIDANHTEDYVWADWTNYGHLGRIVAFHDIGWQERPMNPGKMPIHVPKVWKQIKEGFRHQEIRNCPRDNGIGVLWRY